MPPPPTSSSDAIPRLRPGVELLGLSPHSGLEQPRHLARRPDGVVVQLTPLLALIAENADGRRSLAEIAAAVAAASGRPVTAADVRHLIGARLTPAGLVVTDEEIPLPPKADPGALSVRMRVGLVPERAVGTLARAFAPLFWPPLVALALVALVLMDVWLVSAHGVLPAIEDALSAPAVFLALAGVGLLACVVHELGHAAACRYGGARPGRIGAGLYIVWPAFFTDVTDSYRLSRAGRLRVDLGGIYFNALFCLGAAGVAVATGFEPLLLVVVTVQLMALQQFVPWLRLDGYYVVSDLAGVPDLFSRMGPVLRGLRPGRPLEPRAAELVPRARRVIVAWVATAVPVLMVVTAALAVQMPDVVAEGVRQLDARVAELRAAAGDGRAMDAAAALVEAGILASPVIGFVLVALLGAARAAGAGRRPAVEGAAAP
jgi:putative peptide zinc metalloprotease protein